MFQIFDNNDQKPNKEKLKSWKQKFDQHKPGILKTGQRKFDTQEIDPEEIRAKRAAGGEAENSSIDATTAEDLQGGSESLYEFPPEKETEADDLRKSPGSEDAGDLREFPMGEEADDLREFPVNEDAGGLREFPMGEEADDLREFPVGEGAGNLRKASKAEVDAKDLRRAPRAERKKIHKRWWYLAAAAAVLLIAVGGIFYYTTFTVSSTITTEGEAPIVFYLNHRDQVLRAEALNKTGEEVLKKLGDISHRPDWKDVLARTEAVMKKMGLLGEDEHLKYTRNKGRDGSRDEDDDALNNEQEYTPEESTKDKPASDNDSKERDDSEKNRDSTENTNVTQASTAEKPTSNPEEATDNNNDDSSGQTTPSSEADNSGGGGSDDGGTGGDSGGGAGDDSSDNSSGGESGDSGDGGGA